MRKLTVANVSSAAQYFHLLRRQAAILGKEEVRPLVVMTPKSLLRHPLATSDVSELTEGSFQRVIEQSGLGEAPDRVKRLVFCSGKMAIDLAEAISKSDENLDWLQIVRVEELYPFPAKALKEVIARYESVEEMVWVQEEPKNMGRGPSWNLDLRQSHRMVSKRSVTSVVVVVPVQQKVTRQVIK